MASDYTTKTTSVAAGVVPNDITGDSNHTSVTRLAGWSIRESAGTAAAATVRLRDASATGQIFAVVELAADSHETVLFPGVVVAAPGGVYVEVVAGTVEGVIFHRED